MVAETRNNNPSWRYEAHTSFLKLGLDEHNAHVQPNVAAWTTNATGVADVLNRGSFTAPITNHELFHVTRTGLALYDP